MGSRVVQDSIDVPRLMMPAYLILLLICFLVTAPRGRP